MMTPRSVDFFERQFQRQVQTHQLELNPFERLALPWLRGQLLDYGCGLGNLSVAAARQGCQVLALDASPTAIAHLRQQAQTQGLAIEAQQADLSDYQLQQDYDSIVCIGLLMFLSCEQAERQLAQLQQRLRPGGTLVLNVLVQGTTYTEMFDAHQHCLWTSEELLARFADWTLQHVQAQDFDAPGDTIKSFLTVIASKPRT
jgi:tellurite methyltransferase